MRIRVHPVCLVDVTIIGMHLSMGFAETGKIFIRPNNPCTAVHFFYIRTRTQLPGKTGTKRIFAKMNEVFIGAADRIKSRMCVRRDRK